MISSPQYDGIVPTEDLIRFVTPYGQLLVALRPDAAPKTVSKQISFELIRIKIAFLKICKLKSNFKGSTLQKITGRRIL